MCKYNTPMTVAEHKSDTELKKMPHISSLWVSYMVSIGRIWVELSRQQGSWDLHGAHLGPTGPRWALCWPHEPCYQGGHILTAWHWIWFLLHTGLTHWMCLLALCIVSPSRNKHFDGFHWCDHESGLEGCMPVVIQLNWYGGRDRCNRTEDAGWMPQVFAQGNLRLHVCGSQPMR